VAVAKERMQSNKNPVSDVAIKRLRQRLEFTDEVEVALRLLDPTLLSEVMEGEDDIKSKLDQVPNRNKFMMSVISKLDQEVEAMVTSIMQLDTAGKVIQKGSPTSPAKAPAPAPVVEEAVEEPREEVEQEPAEDDAPDEEAPPVVSEVERRIQENRTPMGVKIVSRLKKTCGFGEEVELGLRMLNLDQLRLVAQQPGLVVDLEKAPNKDDFLLSKIGQVDREVERLVMDLRQADESDGGQDSGRPDQRERSRSPHGAPRLVMPPGKSDSAPSTPPDKGGKEARPDGKGKGKGKKGKGKGKGKNWW